MHTLAFLKCGQRACVREAASRRTTRIQPGRKTALSSSSGVLHCAEDCWNNHRVKVSQSTFDSIMLACSDDNDAEYVYEIQ